MESSPSRPAVKKGRRAVQILGGLAGLCVLALLAIWWHIANDNLVIQVPNPVMPNPNAFDFYVAAANGVVNNKQIDDAVRMDPKKPVTLAQKEAAVQQNLGVINTLHQGFVHEYRNPPARSFSTLFPYFAQERRLSRLLWVQSQVREAHGDWKGAVESALDAIKMGEDLPRGGVLIAQLVGVACEGGAQREMWKAVEHLNAAQSRAAIQRLEAITAQHVPFAETLREEKWMGQAGLQEALSKVTTRSALSNANGLIGFSSGSDEPTSKRYRTAFYMLYGKKRVLQNYTTLMDAAIAQAQQPFQAKPPPLPVLDPVTEQMLPEYDGGRVMEVRAKTQNNLLLIALALHAYRLEHGHYPSALAELTPAYLKQIPDDPFARQGAPVYRLQGEKFVLYSIGPDGKDDGGKPIDVPKNAVVNNPKARYRVEQDSKGDIVSGTNIP